MTESEAGSGDPGVGWQYVVLFFLAVTVLLTWPLLLRPGQVHLTAPAEYYVFQSQEEWGLQWYLGHDSHGREFMDHRPHMSILERASVRLQNLEPPELVHPGFTVPPSYVIPGALVVAVSPVPTVVVHNVFFLVSMFLAGLFTYLLVREVVEDSEVALLAGALYMSSFYLFYVYTLGHTNQWQIQWIPLVLFGLERVSEEYEPRNVAVLVAALALQALSSEQYTVYLTFVLPLYVLLRYLSGASKFRSFAFWKGLGVAAVLALFVVSPYAATRLSMAGAGNTEIRSLQENLYHWYVIERTNVVGVMFAPDARPQFLFRLALLVLGAIATLTVSRRRQLRLLPFAVLFVVGLALAWGPFAAWAPYTLLYEYWPLVEYFRVPYRTLPFALLGSSTLSAAVLLRVSKPDDGWTQRGMAVIAAVVGVQIALVHYLLQFSGYSV